MLGTLQKKTSAWFAWMEFVRTASKSRKGAVALCRVKCCWNRSLAAVGGTEMRPIDLTDLARPAWLYEMRLRYSHVAPER